MTTETKDGSVEKSIETKVSNLELAMKNLEEAYRKELETKLVAQLETRMSDARQSVYQFISEHPLNADSSVANCRIKGSISDKELLRFLAEYYGVEWANWGLDWSDMTYYIKFGPSIKKD